MHAKSSINTRSTYTPRSSSPSAKDSHPGSRLLARSRTAASSSRLRQHYSLAQPQAVLSATLASYSSVTRELRRRAIEEENCKLLSRIVAVPPTLKRKNWAQMQQQHEAYKQNLRRRKCKRLHTQTDRWTTQRRRSRSSASPPSSDSSPARRLISLPSRPDTQR